MYFGVNLFNYFFSSFFFKQLFSIYILFLYTYNLYVELELDQQTRNNSSGLEDNICFYSIKYQNCNFDV